MSVSSLVSAHFRKHSKRSAISLSLWFAHFQPGLATNRSGQELGPTQPSVRSLTAIKIHVVELPHLLGAGWPIITSVIDYTPSRLSRVRTELLHLAIVEARGHKPPLHPSNFLARNHDNRRRGR